LLILGWCHGPRRLIGLLIRLLIRLLVLRLGRVNGRPLRLWRPVHRHLFRRRDRRCLLRSRLWNGRHRRRLLYWRLRRLGRSGHRLRRAGGLGNAVVNESGLG